MDSEQPDIGFPRDLPSIVLPTFLCRTLFDRIRHSDNHQHHHQHHHLIIRDWRGESLSCLLGRSSVRHMKRNTFLIISVTGNGHHVIGPQFGSLLWYFIMRANNLSFCGQFFFILKNVEKLLVTIKNYFARGGPPSKKPLHQKLLS